MKLFSSKTETIVTASIAAFLVLITLAFTFEPLVSLMLASRNLPENTLIMIKIAPAATAEAIYEEGTTLAKGFGATIPDNDEFKGAVIQFLSKFSGERSLIFTGQSVGNLPITPITTGSLVNVESLDNAIRVMAAHIEPSKNRVNMPDDTYYYEIVADPEKASIDSLPIPLRISPVTEGYSLSISSNSPVSSEKILIPNSCRITKDGLRVIAFNSNPILDLSTFSKTFFAYLSNYSCFQSFSTVSW